MKRLPVLIVAIALAMMAVVAGCGRTPRYDGRLVAADSLMRSAPDSALAIVADVCRDSLAAEGDRAYRDLLLTQARYRCYVTATSDSDINRALAYYRAHPKEREKLTRSYIYKGAVMEELGHPDSAMLYYKHAEAAADTADYFNLGYCNMRIAQLYQYFYANDSAVVARMQQATRFFKISEDTVFLITTIGTQGAYPRIIGQDSARIYLEKAIHLAKMIKSPKGFQYQSKLAAINFYDGKYHKAKDLAMDIVRNGKDKCNEMLFYYYAARSFIRLGCIDSARWLMSRIPPPVTRVDSMNHYQLFADLFKATQQYEDFERYSEAAKRIDTRILEESRGAKLIEYELKWDADQLGNKVKNEVDTNWKTVICLVLLVIAVLFITAFRIANRRISSYRRQLDSSRQELEKMLAEIEENRLLLEAINEKHEHQISEKNKQLAEMHKKRLEFEQESINSQVSIIVRYRHAALNELYNNIRIKSVTDDGRKRLIPLIGIIKELYETKGILNKPLPVSFWKNLKNSVDGEFQGIASFVEQQYTLLSEKDLRLFMLLCADFPNQIIKICMNYTHDVTVSKNKKKLMRDKFGFEGTINDFVKAYLEGKCGTHE